jgi:hypothetical protein
MMKAIDGSIARSLAALDQQSRLRIRIFTFKLLILVPISVAFATHRDSSLLGTMSFFCLWHSIFAGFAALLQHHKQNAVFLTAWDEMAAFLALAVLMRLVGAAIG